RGRGRGPHHLVGRATVAPLPASPASASASTPVGTIGSERGRRAGTAALGARDGGGPRPPPRAPVAVTAAVTAAPSEEPFGRGRAARAAEVAAPARGGVLVAEVAPERHAPAPGLVGVLDHGAQAPRVLAAQDLKAAPQALHPLDQRIEGHGRMDAPLAHPLAHAGLDQRRHQRGGGALRDARRESQLLDVGVAFLARPRRQRASEAPEERRGEAREREEMLLDLEVALVEEENAARTMAVAPGAPGLLQVALERGRRLIVDDVADVGLVDAEAEGAGRHHDDALALADEARLVLGAVLVGHLAVV